jgi:hypothetical protein
MPITGGESRRFARRQAGFRGINTPSPQTPAAHHFPERGFSLNFIKQDFIVCDSIQTLF